ncbi:MAG: hypothetical protein J6P95_02765 [Paludibacteraceae bacterium]|nr:hypothetical protein [Paludibacteraceae bacterium]
MREKFLQFFIVTLISLLLSSCAYKRLFKEGKKYEEAGMLELSVEKYNASLIKKEDFTDARIALNRTIIRYANELEQQIDNNYTQLDDDALVENFIKLKNLKNIADNNRIQLEIGSRTQEQYNESQQRYVIDHYANVLAFIETEDFSTALSHILAIKKVDTNYKDIVEKEIICRCEPLYREALQQMQLEKYRTAYNTFKSIIKIGGNYKDSKSLQDECLEKGMLTVAFTSFYSNDTSKKTFIDKLKSSITTTVQNSNAIFLEIVDINNTEAIVKEQHLAMQNGIEIQGTLIPVRSHLTLDVPQLTYTKSSLTKTKKKGFIKEIQKDKSVVYHKVYYYECTQSAVAKVTLNYNLKSTETGLTLLSNSYSLQTSDKVHYIEYSGKNASNLLSGSWENQGKFNPEKDRVNDNYTAKNNIQTLLKARTSLKSSTELQNVLCTDIAKKLSNSLLNYNPEK